MSLVTPGIAQEHETITFWEYLFNKRYFVGEAWFVASQKPPSSATEDRRRRIDLNINYYDGAIDEVKIIAIVEGKKTSTQPAVVENVEAQAYEACAARCKSGGSVWAITVIGTAARVWKFTTLPVPSWECVTGGDEPEFRWYIDADSAAAAVIDRQIRAIPIRPPQSSFIVPSQAQSTTF
ncbi:hypothetical protein BDU57DRAFT_562739 [Ampelomyces quisqualis]|uniref:Type I restriction enzyme R protein N-terminal domain-containing protein n=1 Tax=Ampelomyces quisqualis TaxID=50730 RepID=A0A6A5R1X3_AMPQU|nr:hypothetical protein BDU57DRAFT_562739 [Ampelomyces quisqualis]